MRQIINRHVPTAAQVDHDTVALVLILNRLSVPWPLYQITDWLAQTVSELADFGFAHNTPHRQTQDQDWLDHFGRPNDSRGRGFGRFTLSPAPPDDWQTGRGSGN